MQSIWMKCGKHIAALVVFLLVTMVYFSPAVFDGKVVRSVDMDRATGMGSSQMKEYEKTASPGEFSAWSDAMFGGMPYVAGYGKAHMGEGKAISAENGWRHPRSKRHRMGFGIFPTQRQRGQGTATGRELHWQDRACHRACVRTTGLQLETWCGNNIRSGCQGNSGFNNRGALLGIRQCTGGR